MEINTKYFGKLPFVEEEALLFENGLFGFEQNKKYIIIRFENDNDSMLCLQNLEDENLAFIIINPHSFLPDYMPLFSETELQAINATQQTELLLYNICVLHENIKESTINLRCPLVINTINRKARQVILEDTQYSFKVPFAQLMIKEA